MAVVLDIRLWFDDPGDATSRIEQLRECVAAWAPVQGRAWQSRPSRSGKLSTFTSARVSAAADADRAPVRDVPLTVEAWGPERFERGAPAFGARGLLGDAAVWLQRCWPWVAPRDATLAADAGIDAIESNLASLVELLVHLVDELDPAALKVFTDVAAYLPIDAHATYVQRGAAVVADLQLLAQAWSRGVPGIEPLEQARPDRAFHEWRGGDGNAALHAALARMIGNADAVTADMVDAVLGSGRFTTHACGRGMLVLDYPYVVNGFVDEFLLAVLEEARE